MQRSHRTRAGAVALLLAGVVAGCSGSGGGGGGGGIVEATGSTLGGFFRGTSDEQTPVNEQIPQVTNCPAVRIQAETEVLRREAGGGGGASATPASTTGGGIGGAGAARLAWQATVTKTARECSRSGTGVVMRVGVAGRVLKGPAGAPQRVDLPVRIAVRQGYTVVSSTVRTVSVTLSGPSADWAYVEENLSIPTPTGAEVLVGFDG